MGAWGHGSFENDTALDWLADFEGEGADTVLVAIADVTNADVEEDIDVDRACVALAATEIIAALKTGDEGRLNEEARTALATYRDDIDVAALAPVAARAVARIAEESELKELWEETEDFDAWSTDLDALLDRLR
jgi:hypothetical protein